MFSASKFKDHLKMLLPDVSFYVGRIDKDVTHCIGVYTSKSSPRAMAIGGPQNSSYSVWGSTILVHWGKSATDCENMANTVYEMLNGMSDVITQDGTRIVSVDLLDPHPIDIKSDDKGILEMIIRANVYYDKEVANE